MIRSFFLGARGAVRDLKGGLRTVLEAICGIPSGLGAMWEALLALGGHLILGLAVIAMIWVLILGVIAR